MKTTGRSGVIDLFGVRIAFLSGVFDPMVYESTNTANDLYSKAHFYRKEQIQQLSEEIQTPEVSFSKNNDDNTFEENNTEPIDIFLTHESFKADVTSVDSNVVVNPQAAEIIDSLVCKNNARYHFFASDTFFYEAPPFKFDKFCHFSLFLSFFLSKTSQNF